MGKPTITQSDTDVKKKNKSNKVCKNFPIKYKLEIINRLKREPLSEVLKDVDVKPKTVKSWEQNRKQLEEALEGNIIRHKRRRDPKNAVLDEAVYIWLSQLRKTGVPVSGVILKQRALDLHQNMNCETKFTASEGWLRNFKKRYNIKRRTIGGEKLSGDEEAAKKFVTKFKDDVESKGMSRKQVFNFDESPLNFKSLSTVTFSTKEESEVSGFKKNKDRLTITACCNADGTFKLPLIVISKAKNPRALKGISKDQLPVYYRHQQNAWMSTQIFEEWFRKEFVPKVTEYLINEKLPVKAVLLVDNCKAHPYLRVNNIETVFLLPNVTALIQPLDQGILEAIKRRYKYILTVALASKQQDNVKLPPLLKDVTIKEVIYWVSQSWEAEKRETIHKC